ncbi:MAG TPA: LCP family protein [Streptosporangiaceae bacterium]
MSGPRRPGRRDYPPPGPVQPRPGAADQPDIPAPRPGYYPPPPRAGVPGRRQTAPAQQLMGRIAAGRKARHRRALLILSGTMSALVLVFATGAWGLTSYVNDSVGRVNAGTAGTPSSGPLNILLAGVDLRSGLTRQQQQALHVGHDVSTNSDTMMLIHVSGDRSHVTVVSLPRDSWVQIPGHGMNKINAAFGLGGPELMVKTVEQNTGLTVNDFIEVNFLGFVKVIDALGGVNVCLPYAVNDSYSGLNLAAGVHHVDGLTALAYARDRHSFALSDLARIQDQQRLLASLLSEAIRSGTLADPVRLSGFLRAAVAAIKVDQSLNVTALADQLRGISSGGVAFMTVPLASMNYLTPTGQSAVLWDGTAADALFTKLKGDQPVIKPAATPHGKSSGGLHRRQVPVEVYNGTLIGGLSAGTGADLTQLGFPVTAGLTWSRQDITQTLIEYPPGHQAAAQLVGHVMPGATLRQVSGLAKIRIVLGINGHTVMSTSGTGPSSASSTAKTAAQYACK